MALSRESRWWKGRDMECSPWVMVVVGGGRVQVLSNFLASSEQFPSKFEASFKQVLGWEWCVVVEVRLVVQPRVKHVAER